MINVYFTISELCYSDTAASRHINNQPTPDVVDMLERLIYEVLNPLREKWGSPIIVSSGYRCKKLNDVVKGSKTSAHMLGAAADIQAQNGDNKGLFELAKQMIENGEIEVSQLINEYPDKNGRPSWVHIACVYDGSKKNNILTLG